MFQSWQVDGPICRIPTSSAPPKRTMRQEKRWSAHVLDTNILIAGTAPASNGVLITHNTAEFSRVEQLTLEDWY